MLFVKNSPTKVLKSFFLLLEPQLCISFQQQQNWIITTKMKCAEYEMQKRWTINQGKTNLHNKWKTKEIKKFKNEYEEALKIKEEVHNDAKIRGKQRRKMMQQKWNSNK